MDPQLMRQLKKGSIGKDVEACARAGFRFMDDRAGLRKFDSDPVSVRRTYGVFKVKLFKHVQLKMGLPQTGVVGPDTFARLVKAGAFDDIALKLLEPPKVASMIYPHPAKATTAHFIPPIHTTGGLAGNKALDFMAPPGTEVLIVEDAEITRLSGHNPDTGVHGKVGDVFGWNIYYKNRQGYEYFSTHYGERRVEVGMKLPAGSVIGIVGDWPHDPGRSHTHLGITSPKGTEDASERITAVAHSPRV